MKDMTFAARLAREMIEVILSDDENRRGPSRFIIYNNDLVDRHKYNPEAIGITGIGNLVSIVFRALNIVTEDER